MALNCRVNNKPHVSETPTLNFISVHSVTQRKPCPLTNFPAPTSTLQRERDELQRLPWRFLAQHPPIQSGTAATVWWCIPQHHLQLGRTATAALDDKPKNGNLLHLQAPYFGAAFSAKKVILARYIFNRNKPPLDPSSFISRFERAR